MSYEAEEENAIQKFLGSLRKNKVIALAWNTLCYVLGFFLLSELWKSFFGGKDPTPEEKEEHIKDLEFYNNLFIDFKATLDTEPSADDRRGEGEIYNGLTLPQKRAVNLLRLHTEKKQGNRYFFLSSIVLCLYSNITFHSLKIKIMQRKLFTRTFSEQNLIFLMFPKTSQKFFAIYQWSRTYRRTNALLHFACFQLISDIIYFKKNEIREYLFPCNIEKNYKISS